MSSCHKLLISILLIFLPGSPFARQIVSNTFQKVVYAIPYYKGDGKLYVNGNKILREMAKDVLREPWLVKIRISGVLGLSVVKEGGRDQLLISWSSLAIGGDTVYRNFPVTDVLLPSFINMKLRWANRADTSGFTEETLAGKPLPHSDSLVCAIPIAPFDPATDTLMIREVEFFYDSLSLRDFIGRIELIHDYYASLSLLDSLQHFTAGLHLDNAGLLPVNYLKLEELSSVIERIRARDFPEKLLRMGFDPSGLMEKHSQVFKHSRSLVYNFIDEIHKVGIIPWDGNVDKLAMYFTSRIYSYVQRSYLMDQQQGRIYGDCLAHFFDLAAFPKEENVGATMLTKMFPGARQDTVARYISKRVYASYRNAAQQLMNNSQYAEAFSMMENGRRFIAENPYLQDTEADDVLQSLAAEGICNSYIGIASTCIRNHKYNMAETYLFKADQYAVEHARFIKSDSNYRAVFSELFFLRNTDCDQLLDQKKYAEALDCYQQFEEAYSAHDLALVSVQLGEKKSTARAGLGNLSTLLSEDALKRKDSGAALLYYEQAATFRQESDIAQPGGNRLDSLAPIMARIKFDQIVKDGAIALEKRQFTLAVNLLNEAKLLAGSFRIDRGREFDSLSRHAMKNYLIVQLSVSQKKIWANLFDSAQAALQKTETVAFDYGLSDDPDLSAAIDKFKMKISEQQCRNLQDSVDLAAIRANMNVALKKFTNATRYFKEALVLINSGPDCHFDQEALTDSLALYMKPSEYQRNENTINALIAVGDYSGSIDLLIENQALFKAGNLLRFGLKQVDFYEFISDKNNPYLTEGYAMFLQKNGKGEEALKFFQLLSNQGVDLNKVKPSRP